MTNIIKALASLKERIRRRLSPIPKIIHAVIGRRLTYLSKDALMDLHLRVKELENAGVSGALIEAGCALGGSAIVIAAAKSSDRPFYVYDVFDMIPPPSDRDGEDVHQRYETIRAGKSKGIASDTYYGYQENLLNRVQRECRDHDLSPDMLNIRFVKGLFQDTMNIEWPVALAHIDGDWYESVRVCLERIVPNLVRGGIVVIDDYDAWSGCRTAVDEYFKGKNADFDFEKKSRLHIIRK